MDEIEIESDVWKSSGSSSGQSEESLMREKSKVGELEAEGPKLGQAGCAPGKSAEVTVNNISSQIEFDGVRDGLLAGTGMEPD